MKPWVWALIMVLIPMAGGALYKAGYDNAVAHTNAQAAQVAQQALDERDEIQVALNNVASAYHQSITQEQVKYERLKSDFKSKPRVQDCVTDPAGTVTATLSADAIRMLEQRRSSEALPEAGAGKISDRKEETPAAL